MILTFELSKDKDQIEIIFNDEGLKFLKSVLNSIDTRVKDIDHLHLKTKEWGGDELTSEVMHPGNILINHVKAVYLNEEIV